MHKNITIYDNQNDIDPPRHLTEFMSWLEAIIAKIPEEYRESAIIDIDTGSSYEDVYWTMTINYSRPENEKEKTQREKDELARRKQVEKQELAYLAQLQAKYKTKL